MAIKGYTIKIGDVDKYVEGYLDPITLNTLSKSGATVTQVFDDGSKKEWPKLPVKKF